MGIFKSIKGWKLSWNTNSELVKPITFEVLEPRILLSGDSLLNVIIPDQDQDMLLDGMQNVVQHAELLETREGEQLSIIGQVIDQEPNPTTRPKIWIPFRPSVRSPFRPHWPPEPPS